ncbi:kinase-like protein [Backusella circina FSU 941]|nr:kinase-like protein [Backusella circina FSU 941]
MTHSFISGHNRIFVFETTLTIQQNILSVFNVVIQSPQSTVSLIRYPFDFMEFHNKIRIHYPKSKVSFPTLRNPSNRWRRLKRRSFRDIISFSRKSNAEKIELYLERCFQHPIISISSVLKDFLSVQRDEDAQLTSQYATSSTLVSEYRPLIKNKPFSLDDLSILKVLGKGCMGKVFLTRSKRDRGLYALKVIKKKWVIQQNEVAHTRAERDILVKLRNQPFLAKLHCLFQTPSELYLVLDYYPGGDIATQLSLKTIFTEEQTRFYATEILEGLSILHKNGIVYRDLKPENVLIHRTGHIVLADFGLSKILTDDDIGEDGAPVTRTFCGTAEYLAPEVLIGEPYTFVVDFWSLGTLVYEMLAGTVC